MALIGGAQSEAVNVLEVMDAGNQYSYGDDEESTLASQHEETRKSNDEWKKYQKSLKTGQNSRRVVEATKSRDAQALKDVLSKHYFGAAEDAEAHMKLVLESMAEPEHGSYNVTQEAEDGEEEISSQGETSRKKNSETVYFTSLLLGLDSEVFTKEEDREEQKQKQKKQEEIREENKQRKELYDKAMAEYNEKREQKDNKGQPLHPNLPEPDALELLVEDDEEYDTDPIDYEETPMFLDDPIYAQHKQLFEAVRTGRAVALENEIKHYKDYQNHLRIWPQNMGLFEEKFVMEEHYVSAGKELKKQREKEHEKHSLKMLEIEHYAIQHSFDQDFALIDRKLGSHLLRVAKYYKDKEDGYVRKHNIDNPEDDEIYGHLKSVIQEQLSLRDDVITAIDEDDVVQDHDDDDDDDIETEPVDFDDRYVNDDWDQQHYDRQLKLQTKRQSEIEDAAITLQMLRIISSIEYARFRKDTKKHPYDQKERKTDLTQSLKECEQFLKDAKDAISAARAVQKGRMEEKKRNPGKKTDNTPKPTFQASNEEKRQLILKQQAAEKRKADANSKLYVYHKGRKRKVEKKTPWTKRSDWKTHDKYDEFQDKLMFHPDLRAYIDRLQAVIERLYTDLAEGRKTLNDMKARVLPKRALQLDRNTLSEVRRYMNPPDDLHKVVQAMLLLFEEDEFTTSQWEKCKTLLNPTGSAHKPGLNRRILSFDHTRVDDRVARRSSDIIEEINFDKALQTSPATAAYYVWTKGALEEVEQKVGLSDEPADIMLQREIFKKAAIYPPPARGRRDPSPSKRKQNDHKRWVENNQDTFDTEY